MVCDALESVFTRFDHDYISIIGKSESEVRKYIDEVLQDKGLIVPLDDYVYIFEVNGETIIKR
jgi:hypothetical protein